MVNPQKPLTHREQLLILWISICLDSVTVAVIEFTGSQPAEDTLYAICGFPGTTKLVEGFSKNNRFAELFVKLRGSETIAERSVSKEEFRESLMIIEMLGRVTLTLDNNRRVTTITLNQF